MAIADQYYICNICHFRTTLAPKLQDHLLAHQTKQPLHFSYFDCFDRLKPLKCTSCDFSTESLVLLRYHLVRHHDQQRFALKAKLKTCKKCKFCTHSNYLWIRHRNVGTCKSKEKRNLKRKRKVLSLKKDGKWHLCGECDYRTNHKGNLKLHLIYKHTPLEKVDWKQCNKCPVKCKTLPSLKQHQKKFHEMCPKSEEIKLHNCQHCDYKTKHNYLIIKHIQRMHSESSSLVQCPHCSFKTNWDRSLQAHIARIHDDSALKCNLCDYRAKHKSMIERHKKKHNVDVKWLKCEHCDFSTKYKHSLKDHVLSKHKKDVDIFQCKHCDYNSPCRNYLKQHMKAVHKTRTHNCEHCSFTFKMKHQLQYHILNKHTVHTEEEKLKCDHCNYFCFNNTYLIRHRKFKHNIGKTIRWYECNKCDYKNQRKNYLISHMYRVHNEGKLIECEQCIFKSGCPLTMLWHKGKHKANKWIPRTVSDHFECYTCGYKTNKKKYIWIHMRMTHLKSKKVEN